MARIYVARTNGKPVPRSMQLAHGAVISPPHRAPAPRVQASVAELVLRTRAEDDTQQCPSSGTELSSDSPLEHGMRRPAVRFRA
jgi:hypothetical protein